MTPRAARQSRRRPDDGPHQPEVAAATAARPGRWALAIVLALAVAVAFGQALRAPFIYDDLESIAGNVTIRRLWPLTVPLTPPADVATSGRPVANLSLALNYAANAAAGVDQAPGGSDPNQTTGYHLGNLLLHLLAGALLFGVVRRTLRGPRLAEQWRAIGDPVAAAVAAIWLLHPLQTEAVLYLTQRTELLVSVFYLATLYGAIRAWDTPDPARRRRWFAVAVAACLAGMGSKEVMISAPMMVLLYERAFRFGSWRETLSLRGERRWFHLALWATTLWLLWFILMGARAETVGFGLGLPWYRYLYSQAWAVAHYLRLAVWPVGLTIDYGRDPMTGFAGVPGAVLLVAMGAATLVAWRKVPPLAFVGSWFFLLLAPSSSVVPIRTEMAAERRIYLALAAIVVLAVVGAVTLARRRAAYGSAARSRVAAFAAVGALCVALAAGTWARATTYRDPEALWREAAARVPTNARAHHNLAMALTSQDPPRLEEAEQSLRTAIRVDSGYLPAWPNLASVVGAQGNTDEEGALLEAVVARSPRYITALQQLGQLYIGLGEWNRAVIPLERVVAYAPSDEAYIALATTYKALNRPGDAVVLLQRALEVSPDREDAMAYLGSTLADVGRGREAVAPLEEAMRRGVNSAFIYGTLALAYAQAGRTADVVPMVQGAVDRAGGDPSILVLGGRAMLAARQPDEAERLLREALRLMPASPEVETRLGMVDAAKGRRGDARARFKRALALDPRFELARQELAELDNMQGR